MIIAFKFCCMVESKNNSRKLIQVFPRNSKPVYELDHGFDFIAL